MPEVLHIVASEIRTSVCGGSTASEPKSQSICNLVVEEFLGRLQSVITLQVRGNLFDVITKVFQTRRTVVVHSLGLMCLTKMITWKLPKLLMRALVF